MTLLLEGRKHFITKYFNQIHNSKTKLKCFHSDSTRETMTWFNYPSLRFEANDYTANNLTTANTTNKIYWNGIWIERTIKCCRCGAGSSTSDTYA